MRLVLLLLLAGCSASATKPLADLKSFTTEDMTAAAALAKSAGDSIGQVCWTFAGWIAATLPVAPGPATALELTRILRSPAFVTACGPMVITDVNAVAAKALMP